MTNIQQVNMQLLKQQANTRQRLQAEMQEHLNFLNGVEGAQDPFAKPTLRQKLLSIFK